MRKQLLILAGLTFLVPGVMLGCSPRETTGEPQAQTQTPTQAQQETGTLQIRANGEEFAREGFVSKDGWKISFNHVYTNLADITAYQSEPPFNPETDKNVQAKEKVVVAQAKTVDLAQSGKGKRIQFSLAKPQTHQLVNTMPFPGGWCQQQQVPLKVRP